MRRNVVIDARLEEIADLLRGDDDEEYRTDASGLRGSAQVPRARSTRVLPRSPCSPGGTPPHRAGAERAAPAVLPSVASGRQISDRISRTSAAQERIVPASGV